MFYESYTHTQKKLRVFLGKNRSQLYVQKNFKVRFLLLSYQTNGFTQVQVILNEEEN